MLDDKLMMKVSGYSSYVFEWHAGIKTVFAIDESTMHAHGIATDIQSPREAKLVANSFCAGMKHEDKMRRLIKPNPNPTHRVNHFNIQAELGVLGEQLVP